MNSRFCRDCGARLQLKTTAGGIPHRICTECGPDESGVFFAGP